VKQLHTKDATALAKTTEQLDSSRKDSRERTSKHNEAEKQWTKDKKATAAQVVVLASLISNSSHSYGFAFRSRS
jgi:hypothetical protein